MSLHPDFKIELRGGEQQWKAPKQKGVKAIYFELKKFIEESPVRFLIEMRQSEIDLNDAGFELKSTEFAFERKKPFQFWASKVYPEYHAHKKLIGEELFDTIKWPKGFFEPKEPDADAISESE